MSVVVRLRGSDERGIDMTDRTAAAQPEVPRSEHPRPHFQRARWTSLNGPWAFAFDDDDVGLSAHWQEVATRGVDDEAGPFDRSIVVPFAPQTVASGIGDTTRHDVAWYARVLPRLERSSAERLLLHIGACDHEATVWVNGRQVAHHVGGYTPFAADVTDALHDHGSGQDDVVVVRAHDARDDVAKPRGKQYWQREPAGVFYTGTTGIWQSVWLEVVHEAAIRDAWLQPVLELASIDVVVDLPAVTVGRTLRIRVRDGERLLVDDAVRVLGQEVRRRVRLSEVDVHRDEGMIVHDGIRAWSPWSPTLYDVELDVVDDAGTVLDHVETYVGMRSIEVRGDDVLLNGLPLYQRLVLDQGYFPDGGYTARHDADLRRDIELAKDLGFIGCRKHQKVEDPRWLYWADRLGFLVWSELPSAHVHSTRSVQRTTATWQEVVVRDRNHPCIIVWVPMNESWGAPSVGSSAAPEQVHHLSMLYHLTRTLDPSRLVVSNDGWEHADTDLFTLHDYGDAAALRDRLATRSRALQPRRARRAAFAVGHVDGGVPILISEFGGISLAASDGWGFHTSDDADEFVRDCADFVGAVVDSGVVVGYCWTQLTDVEQETNGLLTAERRPKAPIEDLRAALAPSRRRVSD